MKRSMSGVLLILVLAGCGGGGGGKKVSVPPVVPPVVTPVPLSELGAVVLNERNYFELWGAQVSINGTYEFTWDCQAGQAEIHLHQLPTGAGSVRLVVLDAAGAVVHDNTYANELLDPSLFAVTRPGAKAGLWTLRFTFDHFVLDGDFAVNGDAVGFEDRFHISGTFSLSSAELRYEVGWPEGPASVQLYGPKTGVVQIQIWDPSGASVYDKVYQGPLAGGSVTSTSPGVAGTWKIRIVLGGVTDCGPIDIH